LVGVSASATLAIFGFAALVERWDQGMQRTEDDDTNTVHRIAVERHVSTTSILAVNMQTQRKEYQNGKVISNYTNIRVDTLRLFTEENNPEPSGRPQTNKRSSP
jgi:hypothetical protein